MGNINHEEFIRSIKQAFEGPPESLGLSTVLRALEGWDSWASVMLVAEIYADCRVQIAGEEMIGCRTVADVMSLVEAKLAPDSQ